MDFVTLVVLTVLVIGGVWGAIILSGLLKRQTAKLEASRTDPRIDELQDDRRLLEIRIERLEEELAFLRELQGSASGKALPAGGDEDRDTESRSDDASGSREPT